MTTTIGFLATGDEVCDGEVVNTNTPQLAQWLIEQGWQIGYTLCVPDNEADIVEGLTYLAKQHDVILTIGGLGPTEDDVTRNALAHFINQALVFNEASWQRIETRFEQLNLPLTENNRQQAFFPAQANILSNEKGSADSCYVTYQNKLLFMLPGPPVECLNVVQDHVLTVLDQHPLFTKSHEVLLKWYLLGAFECQIATEMEALLETVDCKTGYRAQYPYLEFKVWLEAGEQVAEIKKRVDEALASYCVMPTAQIASEYCREYIIQRQMPIKVTDRATAGLLQTRLINAKTRALITFLTDSPTRSENTPDYLLVDLTGLDEFWEIDEADITSSLKKKTSASITFSNKTSACSVNKTLPIRHRTLPEHLAEWVCYEIVQWLKGH